MCLPPDAKSSWSGSARHPKAFLLSFCYLFATSQTFRAATFLLLFCYRTATSLFLHSRHVSDVYIAAPQGCPFRTSLRADHPRLNPTPLAINCLTAWPAPHGRTVNCAPVIRGAHDGFQGVRRILAARPCVRVHSHAHAQKLTGAGF